MEKDKRITFIRNGLIRQNHCLIEETVYGNYKTLISEPLVYDTDLNVVLLHVLDNCINHLESNSNVKLLCTADDAIKVHKIFEKIGV